MSSTSTGTATIGSGTSTRGSWTMTTGMPVIERSLETPTVLPHLTCGSFRFYAFSPTAKHLPDLKERFRQGGVLRAIENLNFPRNTKQKFKTV